MQPYFDILHPILNPNVVEYIIGAVRAFVKETLFFGYNPQNFWKMEVKFLKNRVLTAKTRVYYKLEGRERNGETAGSVRRKFSC